MTDAPLPFEEAMQELERRVRKLESGEIALEEALALFEEGVELARVCHEQLEQAEQRVSQLVHGARGVETRDL